VIVEAPSDSRQPDWRRRGSAAALSELDGLAERLEARARQIGLAAERRLTPQLPKWMTRHHGVWDELIVFGRTVLRAELDDFRRGVIPSNPSEADLQAAKVAAEVGTLKFLLDGYQSLQRSLVEAWIEVVDQAVADPSLRQELLQYGSEYFSAYQQKITGFVVDAFQLECNRARGGGEQRRFEAIRRLIDGDPEAASQLDFDIDQYHVGVVAWGSEAGDAILDLARSLGRISLTIGALNGTRWGWVSGARPLDAAAEQRLGAYEAPAGVGIAVGLEGYGDSGFRTTNGQALRARWVARRLDLRVAFYADVAIEALAGANRLEARSFIAHELRGIDDDSGVSTRIRETILAYFAAEQNAASAAAALGIHQQTVANRLRAAEERLGHPVVSRRVELETALRMRACLGE
jgi:PucR C-terminal helix-turn-helix domain